MFFFGGGGGIEGRGSRRQFKESPLRTAVRNVVLYTDFKMSDLDTKFTALDKKSTGTAGRFVNM